jgi:hypothetical protein
MSNHYQATMLRADRLRADAPKTNHILHLILTLITAGLWVFVWIIVGLINQHRAHYAIKEAKQHEARALRILEEGGL